MCVFVSRGMHECSRVQCVDFRVPGAKQVFLAWMCRITCAKRRNSWVRMNSKSGIFVVL